MKKIARLILLCIFFIFLATLHLLPASSKEVDNEREFNYDNGSDKGPARWGELHREWRLCKNGIRQSPIDLSERRITIVSHLGILKRKYKPSNAILKNRGHDMMFKWQGDAGHIVVNGTRYELRQCHWHSPSEHTINERRFKLEAHLVHESPEGKIVVVGILYKIGRPDSFLSSIMNHLRVAQNMSNEQLVVGVIDPKNIKRGSRKYYRYIGSLTTPPCSENVIWTIVKKVRTVSREQVRLLRVAVHDESGSNARPLQSINGRAIQLYRPWRSIPQLIV